MDFDLPPMPDLKSTAPPPPSDDPLSDVDRFFSDAPVLDEPPTADAVAIDPTDETVESPAPEAVLPIAAPSEDIMPEQAKKEEPKPQKKYVRRMPPKPPFNFKSVKLPETIYRKYYTLPNRHLPVAHYTADMEHGVLASSARGNIGAMRGLKQIGTPLSAVTESGESALTIAARTGDMNTVHWLLVQGADSNATSAGGLTPLHYAAYRGSWEIVDVLLSYGANPNQADANGVTPLMYAARAGAQDAAEVLLEFGANPSAADAYGYTAAHMAERSGNPNMRHVISASY